MSEDKFGTRTTIKVLTANIAPMKYTNSSPHNPYTNPMRTGPKLCPSRNDIPVNDIIAPRQLIGVLFAIIA
jgi:hypothetical protein